MVDTLRGAATTLLIFTVGCQAQAESDQAISYEVIPGTDVSISGYLYLSDEQTSFHLDEKNETDICVDEGLISAYKGAGLNMLAGTNPFASVRTQSLDCTVLFTNSEQRASRQLKKGGPGVRLVDQAAPECKIYYHSEGNTLKFAIGLVESKDMRVKESCFYRLGLFTIGFNGVAQLADDDLFQPVERTPFAGQAKVFGVYPPMLALQQRRGCTVDPNLLPSRSVFVTRKWCIRTLEDA